MFKFLINFYNDQLCINEMHVVTAFSLSDAIYKVTDDFPYLIDGFDYEVYDIIIDIQPDNLSEKCALSVIQKNIWLELDHYHNASDPDYADYLLTVKIGSLLSNVINMYI